MTNMRQDRKRNVMNAILRSNGYKRSGYSLRRITHDRDNNTYTVTFHCEYSELVAVEKATNVASLFEPDPYYKVSSEANVVTITPLRNPNDFFVYPCYVA